MKENLLKILVCPKCRKSLKCTCHDRANGEIKNGSLECENQHVFPIKDFVPYFSYKKKYVDAFDFIWNKTQSCSLSSEKDQKCIEEFTDKEFLKQTMIDPASLKGKLVLDAGCGGGRFVKYLRKFGAEVVGIDLLPTALKYCINLFKDDSHAHFLQADIFNLPFKDGSFDFIYSLGVLHHTPDTKKAFLGLIRFLKVQGSIAIWVYSKYEKTYISDLLRPITKRMPKRMLYILGLLITMSYGPLLKIPRVKNRLKSIFYYIRIPWHDHLNWRIHSLLDWYGPTYQAKHTYEELESWFREGGLNEIVLCPYPVSARGTKQTEKII